jgi:kinetochore protein Mis13/DSN1
MDSEADDLRRHSRENKSSPVASLRSGFAFPATTSQHKDKQRQQQKQLGKVPEQERRRSPEPPPRERDKERRESQHQRRSSMGMRGKRISSSFEATGVIGVLIC